MSRVTHCDTNQYDWQRIMSIVTTIAFLTVIAFFVTACGGGDSNPAPAPTPTPTPTVPSPGVPTNFTVVRTPEVILSATLDWSIPLSGGAPTTFEVYRSTTAASVFHADNHLISIPVDPGKTNYTFIDNTGLTGVDTYWVLSAKNAGGETPTAEVLFKPIGPPIIVDEGYGNNFSSAMIFADAIGISGEPLDPAKSWTNDLTLIDLNTGLRPKSEEITALLALPVPVTTLPNLDPTTTYTLDNVTYYKQQTVSTWQGQWVNGASTQQHVTAKWGDNLISQKLTVNSVIRIEMVLTKALDPAAPMTSYWMKSLYGTKKNEVFGTDGTTYDNLTAFVFASNARLTIQKLDGDNNPDGAALYDQTLWLGDGPGFLAGEVNVAGNFTYGFVWDLKKEVLPNDITTGKSGTWRITFSLDNNSPKGTPNNTYIDTAANGVRVNATSAYIDITVGQ